MDPRESSRSRKKRNWVQVTPEVQPTSEPERVVGRDLSENIKSTSDAFSAPKTKISAEDAPNINTENAKDMDQEVSDKLTNLQSVFESGHRENNIKLDKIYCYLSRDSQSKDITILKLKEIEKSYYSLTEEKCALEKVNHSLADKAHSYKLLSIISTVLLVLTTAISFIVV